MPPRNVAGRHSEPRIEPTRTVGDAAAELWPTPAQRTPAPASLPPAAAGHGHGHTPAPPAGRRVRLLVVHMADGPRAGRDLVQVVPVEPQHAALRRRDDIVLSWSGGNPDDPGSYSVVDFQRGAPLWWLAGLFAAAVLVLGRWRGFAARLAGHPVDARGLLLAGVVIGTLGVLDDVTVTQTSAVWELRRADPGMGTRALFTAAMRIGRDHVSSAVNTLVLAYAGAALAAVVASREPAAAQRT